MLLLLSPRRQTQPLRADTGLCLGLRAMSRRRAPGCQRSLESATNPASSFEEIGRAREVLQLLKTPERV